MARFLIVDDDKDLRELLVLIAKHLGHGADEAPSLALAREKSLNYAYDVVLLDVAMPDGNGLDLLPTLKALPNRPEVIIITAQSNADGAEQAIKNGAWAYIPKPASPADYRMHMHQVLDYREQKLLSSEVPPLSRDKIIGASPLLTKCLEKAAKAAMGCAGVLILGETGTGKELFARAIHNSGDRKDKPFIVVDCAAIPSNLVESTLFGYEKGAFTSADKSRVGLIAQAHEGTLFLDEIGELPLDVQKAFLRVLQEHMFRPLGATSEQKSDFRVIAATNRDLEAMVKSGHFREDLLYRLKSFTINLPPLRERIEDIEPLVWSFLEKHNQGSNMQKKEPSAEYIRNLEAYMWPGNIRELLNVVEQSVANNPNMQVLFPAHLPTHVRVHAAKAAIPDTGEGESSGGKRSGPVMRTFKDFREMAILKAEKQYLEDVLKRFDGDVQQAMETANLSRSRFYALLKKHGIRKKF